MPAKTSIARLGSAVLAVAAACSGEVEPAQLPTRADNSSVRSIVAGSPGAAAAGAAAIAPSQAQVTSQTQASTPPLTVTPQSAGAAPYSELADGKGGINLEQVAYPPELGLDREASLAAFQSTLYPVLRSNCASCHSTETRAQAPLHSDVDVHLAHEYALTRVNFYQPEDSKFVVRMLVDRHNCFARSCKEAGAQMLDAVKAWSSAVMPKLAVIPRGIAEGTLLSDAQVSQWIAADRVTLSAQDADYYVYVSLNELHNAGVSAYTLNVARAGLSKALNSTARWAPTVVNPVDINGMGMVYRFDIRDYWGYNKGVKKLIYGGSDDDIFFGDHKDTLSFRFNFAATSSKEPQFARTLWERVRQGSIDAYKQEGAAANIKGFKPDFVELSQLVYTLSRPDVYNAIMSLPNYAPELEKELGVMKTADIESYQYAVVEQAITIDSRMMFRAQRSGGGGFYWKTFDIFTGSKQVFPFWDHPIPKYVSSAGATPKDLSLMASLLQPTNDQDMPQGCNPSGGSFSLCTTYTGDSGVQQSASEVIWDLPNGLQGYAIYGGLNQRRTDAFSFIVHDPRRLRAASDAAINGGSFGTQDLRLTVGGSCMGCHTDGMNRANNDLRDRLDANALSNAWVSDPNIVSRVRAIYPPSSELRPQIEKDRRAFFDAMAKIRGGMLLGPNKNLYGEPIVWTFEWAQKHYGYADTVSN